MDDVELRQAIERQLNIVELIHRFSKAVFFADNQEFSADRRPGETKEEQERGRPAVVAGCKQPGGGRSFKTPSCFGIICT